MSTVSVSILNDPELGNNQATTTVKFGAVADLEISFMYVYLCVCICMCGWEEGEREREREEWEEEGKRERWGCMEKEERNGKIGRGREVEGGRERMCRSK